MIYEMRIHKVSYQVLSYNQIKSIEELETYQLDLGIKILKSYLH